MRYSFFSKTDVISVIHFTNFLISSYFIMNINVIVNLVLAVYVRVQLKVNPSEKKVFFYGYLSFKMLELISIKHLKSNTNVPSQSKKLNK